MKVKRLKEKIKKLTKIEQAELMHWLTNLLIRDNIGLSDDWKAELERREKARLERKVVSKTAKEVITKYVKSRI